MATLTDYKGLEVVNDATGDGGIAMTDNFKELADRAPYQAAGNPGVNDDSTKGFSPGDQWFNTSSEVLWCCVSNSTGAAVWKSMMKRTATALELIPSESSELVEVLGTLQVKGTGNSSVAGKLGVGLTSPTESLDVTNDIRYGKSSGNGDSWIYARSNPSNSNASIMYLGNGTKKSWNDTSGTDGGGMIRLFSNGSFGTGNVDFSAGGSSGMVRLNTNNSTRQTVTPDGLIGIGTTAPKTRLHSTDSTILGAASSANADADLGNNQVNMWVDEANDLLMFKVKYSNGTVKSGSVALS